MLITESTVDQLAWEKMNQLVPCIVQHVLTGEVLMQGYMNRDALLQTLQTKAVTFYSRSKQRLWQKGEQSGHVLQFTGAYRDCDNDSILVQAIPQGPTCHLGTRSCFAEAPAPFLVQLNNIIKARRSASPDESYTAKLLSQPIKRIAQKVGEEGVEVALAATVQDKDELLNESADLLYHLLVTLEASDLNLEQVLEVLQQRHR